MTPDRPDPIALAAEYAGLAGDRRALRRRTDELLAALADGAADPRVRAAAVGAIVRAGTRDAARRAWRIAARDPSAAVRRRAAELTPAITRVPVPRILELVADGDPFVSETACWAAGEIDWPEPARTRVVAALVTAATADDPLTREAAVAALGALGDARGLPTVLAACHDRPAVRRRAVLALAPFAGPDVEAALVEAGADPDWQTRQAAEDLL